MFQVCSLFWIVLTLFWVPLLIIGQHKWCHTVIAASCGQVLEGRSNHGICGQTSSDLLQPRSSWTNISVKRSTLFRRHFESVMWCLKTKAELKSHQHLPVSVVWLRSGQICWAFCYLTFESVQFLSPRIGDQSDSNSSFAELCHIVCVARGLDDSNTLIQDTNWSTHVCKRGVPESLHVCTCCRCRVQVTATHVMCFARTQLAETKMDDPNAAEEARSITIVYIQRHTYCFTALHQTFSKVVNKTLVLWCFP